MTRDQAYLVFGLYVGASSDHVEAAFKKRELDLRVSLETVRDQETLRELEQQLAQLRLAHQVLTGEPADTQAEAPTHSDVAPSSAVALVAPVKKRRKLLRPHVAVLLLVLAALSYVGSVELGHYNTDRKHRPKFFEGQHTTARTALQEWRKYLAARGHAETQDRAEGAERLLHSVEVLNAGGDVDRALEEVYNLHELLRDAVQREQDALEAAWSYEVARPFELDMAARFPFSVGATEEADLAKVAELFSPTNGTIRGLAQSIQALRAVEFGRCRTFSVHSWLGIDYIYSVTTELDHPANFSPELLADLDAAADLAAALFPLGGESIGVPLRIEISAGAAFDVADIRLGDQWIGDSPGTGQNAIWSPASAGVLLTAVRQRADSLDGSEQFQLDFTGSSWGLLRTTLKCRPEAAEDNFVCWSFDQSTFGASAADRADTESAQLKIRFEKGPNALDPALYAAFKPD